MKLHTTVLASLVTALLLVAPVSAKDQDFVRMFPHLPAFEPANVALANHGALCTPAPCRCDHGTDGRRPTWTRATRRATPQPGSRTSGSSWTTT